MQAFLYFSISGNNMPRLSPTSSNFGVWQQGFQCQIFRIFKALSEEGIQKYTGIKLKTVFLIFTHMDTFFTWLP